MSLSKITMIGLETALAYRNESLFDFMNLPNGIDKDVVEGNILMEGGEFEVLYANPDFMRQMIGIWTQKHYRTFDKWIKALNIEYSPLENYDRFESWDDTNNENSNRKHSGTSKDDNNTQRNGTSSDTSDGSVNNSRSEHDNEHNSGNNKTVTTGKTENEVSAFDSNSYQPENQSTNEGQENGENSSDRTASRNSSDDTSTHSTSNGTTSDNEIFSHSGSTSDNEDYTHGSSGKHTGRIHGNIGVTTSQQMLQSELDIARFNIVQQITDLFLQEFCIMIYS